MHTNSQQIPEEFMARSASTSLLSTLAGATAFTLTSAIGIGAAQAAVLNYAFTVSIDQGPYAGIHGGTFRFETDTMQPCATNPNRLCAAPNSGLLSLRFNFMGTTYDLSSDIDYTGETSRFPAIYYYPERNNSTVSPFVLSLIVMPPKTTTPSFSILGDYFFMGFNRVSDAANPTHVTGLVNYFRLSGSGPLPCDKPGDCQSAGVPEPGELAGTAIAGAVLLGIWRSRRRRS